MAQLKDDCFAFGGDLLPLEDALARLKGRVDVIAGTESIPLDQCLGRIVAETVAADVAVPPHDNSAVDGYAVYFSDLTEGRETHLSVGGRIAAGHPLGHEASRGQAYRIFTGAPMPMGSDGTQASGPDTVFMEEDVSLDGTSVVLPSGLKKGANCRFKGEDITVGQTLIESGTRIRPQDIGLAASVGQTSLTVYRALKVCVFSTGDEIQNPGDAHRDGSVFDANRFTIKALLRGIGLTVTDLGILVDDEESIAAALSKAATNHDLIITTGGVSAGEEDHVKAAIERQGCLDFWRLAIKPGRPIALGHIRNSTGTEITPFFGLPGNPVAAMVTFMMIARPIIFALQGARLQDTTPARFQVPSAFAATKKKGRREWLRGLLKLNDQGKTVVEKYRSSGAGILTSMTLSSGLIELSEDRTDVSPGDLLDYIPFSEVMG